VQTHLAAEVWLIATHRNLHPKHPVHLLLQNHFHKTLAINTEAREDLLPRIINKTTCTGKAGAVDLGAKRYAEWNFEDAYLKNDLKKRGLYDPSLPVNKQFIKTQDFRDFSIPVWNAVESYVRKLMAIFYAVEKVEEDMEIQNWAKDIATEGRMIGFPSNITSFNHLVEVLTMVIYTCSAQHAAINFNQYDMLAYIPNMPLTLNIKEWPTSKNDINMTYIFASLPDFNQSNSQLASVKVLSALPFFRDQTLLHPIKWVNPAAQAVVFSFIEELHRLSGVYHEINANRPEVYQYRVLYPENIPMSIAI